MVLYEKSHLALRDWQEIVEYTLDNHGVALTKKYTSGLIDCIEAMANGKGYFKDTKIKGRSIRIKHCQKHYIFSLVPKDAPIIVIAFFHERMDLMTRLKKRLG